jgi:alpha-aminoadipate/glutamate carrier protein LysW
LFTGFLSALIEVEEIDQMSAPTCPECGGNVTIPTNAIQHELIPCPDCGTELEIVSLNPLALELAPEVQEDWGE